MKKRLLFLDKFNRQCLLKNYSVYYVLHPLDKEIHSFYDLNFDFLETKHVYIFDPVFRKETEKSIKTEKHKKYKIKKITKQLMSGYRPGKSFTIRDINDKDFKKEEKDKIIKDLNKKISSQDEIQQKSEEIQSIYVIYATLYNKNNEKDGKFRIVDNRKNKKTKNDKRTIITGMDINSLKVEQLEDIVRYYNITITDRSKHNLIIDIQKFLTEKNMVIT